MRAESSAQAASTHVVSLAVMTVLFALIFRLLPDVKMRWADVWLGALLSAVLFELGNLLFTAEVGPVGHRFTPWLSNRATRCARRCQ